MHFKNELPMMLEKAGLTPDWATYNNASRLQSQPHITGILERLNPAFSNGSDRSICAVMCGWLGQPGGAG